MDDWSSERKGPSPFPCARAQRIHAAPRDGEKRATPERHDVMRTQWPTRRRERIAGGGRRLCTFCGRTCQPPVWVK